MTAYAKRPHVDGCDGALYYPVTGSKCEWEWLDRTGRLNPNGSYPAVRLECNRRWDGCDALVFVTRTTVLDAANEALRALEVDQ